MISFIKVSIILPIFYVPAIIDLLLGYSILRKKTLFFFVAPIFIPLLFPIFIWFLVFGPPHDILHGTIYFSYLFEVILLIFLGLLVLDREWVRSPNYPDSQIASN